MLEVRIHGRGGQGVVTAAELLSLAAFAEDRHAQAFPSFGSERMGGARGRLLPDRRAGDRSREPVSHPDALIVQDATLLHQVDVFSGLKDDGYVLVNSGRSTLRPRSSARWGCGERATCTSSSRARWAGDSVRIARLAKETGLFPVFEAERGDVVGVSKIRRRLPVEEYLSLQRRYAHLFEPTRRDDVIAHIQARADRNIERFGLVDRPGAAG